MTAFAHLFDELPEWARPFADRERWRAWIKPPGLSVYVRRTKRAWDLTLIPTLEIATVEATRPGKGAFKAWLPEFEAVAETFGCSVYVENVLTDRFGNFLSSQGYTPKALPSLSSTPQQFCYWKHFPDPSR